MHIKKLAFLSSCVVISALAGYLSASLVSVASKESATKEQLARIARHVKDATEDYGTTTVELQTLIDRGAFPVTDIRDAWGNQVELKRLNDCDYELISHGDPLVSNVDTNVKTVISCCFSIGLSGESLCRQSVKDGNCPNARNISSENKSGGSDIQSAELSK